MNPLIYSLRNKDVKVALKQTISMRKFWSETLSFYSCSKGRFCMFNQLSLSSFIFCGEGNLGPASFSILFTVGFLFYLTFCTIYFNHFNYLIMTLSK
jgi:hypothetical protein